MSSDRAKHCFVSCTRQYEPDVSTGLLAHDVDSVHYVSLGQCENMSNVFQFVKGMGNYGSGEVGAIERNVPLIPLLNHTISSEINQSVESSKQFIWLPEDIADAISNGPVQLRLTQFPLTQFGSQKRAFSLSNYERYPFIEYSVSADAIFCFACRFFSVSGNAELTFVKTGFCHWKRLSAQLQKTFELSMSPTEHGILVRVAAINQNQNSFAKN